LGSSGTIVRMRLDSRPARAERIIAHRGDEELLLLDPEDGSYYALEEVGARIWELCDGKRRVADIAATLNEEFDAPPEAIRADLFELLEELSGRGLVVDAAG
jgi:hypothetical protein